MFKYRKGTKFISLADIYKCRIKGKIYECIKNDNYDLSYIGENGGECSVSNFNTIEYIKDQTYSEIYYLDCFQYNFRNGV